MVKFVLPSLTHFLPRCINKRLQYLGERWRSFVAQQESEAKLPFPYNDPHSLEAYQLNKKIAEPDFDPYWEEQKRLMELKYVYNTLPLLKGHPPCELTLIP